MDHTIALIKPKRFGDARGWFTEVYSEQTFENFGITNRFVQDNHSLSVPAGTIRGLHFQTPPFGQAKLVRCIRGSIFDVAVDVRNGSPSYGKWVGVELSQENGHQLYIPVGFAHGFMTLQPDTEVCYKVTAGYAPKNDGGIRWDDGDIGIEWPFTPDVTATLSDKDLKLPTLAEFESPFSYETHGNEPLKLVEL
ncbi:dTDP-4-dehydrorhamnose 3,5-epimerase [Agrobacterium rubi TR3 = NBRC 13261]|uniref:dTDP-4-dehydrorhamnose 3,5-epimerase n=1 Tax=Agrobacterium rubi TR3 = NBRC 13261 TaxID=1368415 RepID=A0A081D347_9HYPH|nr:dTDP-4-dehydrorhamnose 3,5-epimerase [Agrobacterium rubi]MBP1881549.1 dTDP-4-dehydrorhamnose 3,5-epimerase [Agrobacterium rubi]GAK73343.1 dTDP-4-dehydrorhamnose 3,5-epimerase [Agrobacterium rubi TR3 = NBRC 13261]